MTSKFVIVIISIVLLLLSWAFFATNNSYQEAIKSRFYYEISNYDKAHELAKIAYAKDNYNKMAYTVMVQSEISMRFSNYIKRGEAYLDKILKISKLETVDKAQATRIKLICEIMVDDFHTLVPSRLTDKALQDEAKNMRDKFLELQKQLF
ncbi:MAG: hypothetical protein ACTTJC_05535 [Campylobacter sp.]